jgi:hypothetical protein
LCAEDEVAGKKLVGLRTELPFQIDISVDANGRCLTRWTVGGEVDLAQIGNINAAFNGRIDLAIALDGEGGPTLQVVDLKTEGCGEPFNPTEPEKGHELQALVGDHLSTNAQSPAEQELLDKHRLQLALYTMVLERLQSSIPEDKRRKILPPAIQASASGRLIAMSEDELVQAKLDFAQLLERMVEMRIRPQDEPARLPSDQSETCKTCPYYFGQIRLCGPEGEQLGIIT